MHALRQRRKIAELEKERAAQGEHEKVTQQSDCCLCWPNVSAQFQCFFTGLLIFFLQILAFYSFIFYTGNVGQNLTPAGTVQRAVSALFIQQVPNNMFSFVKKMHPKLAHELVESVKQLEKGMTDVEDDLEERKSQKDVEMGTVYKPPTPSEI
jgi:hypothetical protein